MTFSTLCSCGIKGDYKTPSKQAEETLLQILDSIENEDAETIKGYFSPYAQDNIKDLNQKINDSFNFFDGKIVSYDEPFGRASGPFDSKDTGATINITTDKGTEYLMAIRAWNSNYEEPEKIGVYSLYIRNDTMMSDITVEDIYGYNEEYEFVIQCKD
jgi:hypothetical protein